MRRIIKFAGYAFSALGIFLLILWAIRGARPALDCGLVDAVSAQDWSAAYTCLDQSDYDPLIGIFSLVGGFMLALAARFALGGEKSREYNPTPEERKNNREILIGRVRSIWIDGYLNQSLYQEVLLLLGMEWNAADPLPASYGMKAKRKNQAPSLGLAAGPQMATFYEQVNHQLLILGAPGAGKTTVMLDLAKSYLDRADNDATVPVPVILTLSSWPGKETPFDDWLVSEMRARYGGDITDKVALYWLEHNEIALFLDGLDELPADRRSDAVAAIEAFRKTALARWFVVCSRAVEYGALANRFTELDGVEIEPMTTSQIQGYLAEVQGETIQPQIARLGNTINADTTIQEVADTPLMLNVMLLAAYAIDWRALPAGQSADAVRGVIYDAYIEDMLVRPRNGAQYTAARTLKWLQWLAQKMVEDDQTAFLLERMNRSWFREKRQGYVWLFTYGLIFWLFFGLIFGLSGGRQVGLTYGAFLAVMLGAAFGSRDIFVAEQVRYRYPSDSVRVGLIYVLPFMLIFAPIMTLIYIPIYGQEYGTKYISYFALIFGPILFVIIALMRGLKISSDLEESNHSMRVNYGIRQSLKSGLAIWLIGSVIFWVIFGLAFQLIDQLLGGRLYVRWSETMTGPIGELGYGIVVGLNFGSIFGLAFGLVAGLDSVIKHYTLRLVLWRDGSMPLNYVRFLDACADRILLRKVGGGYMFPHITFRDYFAALTPERIDELARRVAARQGDS